MTPQVDIDLTTLPLPLLAIGLEPGEVLQVAGEDRETDVRLDEEGVLDKDHVPVASPVQGSPHQHPVLAFAHLLHQVRGVCQIRVRMSSAEVGKDDCLDTAALLQK